MDEELEKLLLQAEEDGASDEEMIEIITKYDSEKEIDTQDNEVDPKSKESTPANDLDVLLFQAEEDGASDEEMIEIITNYESEKKNPNESISKDTESDSEQNQKTISSDLPEESEEMEGDFKLSELENEQKLIDEKYNKDQEIKPKDQDTNLKELDIDTDGSVIGKLYNDVLEGIGSVASGITDLSADLTVATFGKYSMYGTEYSEIWQEKYENAEKEIENDTSLNENEKWDAKQEKYSEINDELKKFMKKKNNLEGIRTGLKDLIGDSSVGDKYSKEFEDTFFGGAFSGLAKSIPAMISPNSVASFALQSLDAVSKEMNNNPEFDDVTENEKWLVKAPVAAVNAVLEEYGFRSIFKKKGILNNVTFEVIKDLTGKKISSEILKKSVKSAATKIAKGGLMEFETGGLQQFGEISIKNIYDYTKDNEMFKASDGWVDIFQQVVKSAAQEAVGGFSMSAFSQSATLIRENKAGKQLNNSQYKFIENISTNKKTQVLVKAHLFKEYSDGNITEEDYNKINEDINETTELFQEISETDFSGKQKRKALDLLYRKKSLEKTVKDKDKNLYKKQHLEIASINEKLEKISQEKLTDEQKKSVSELEKERDSELDKIDAKVKESEKTGEKLTDEDGDVYNAELEKDLINTEFETAIEKAKETSIEEASDTKDSQATGQEVIKEDISDVKEESLDPKQTEETQDLTPEQKKEGKPTLKMRFVTKAEMTKADNLNATVTQDKKIREDYKEVKKLMDCLWK